MISLQRFETNSLLISSNIPYPTNHPRPFKVLAVILSKIHASFVHLGLLLLVQEGVGQGQLGLPQAQLLLEGSLLKQALNQISVIATSSANPAFIPITGVPHVACVPSIACVSSIAGFPQGLCSIAAFSPSAVSSHAVIVVVIAYPRQAYFITKTMHHLTLSWCLML